MDVHWPPAVLFVSVRPRQVKCMVSRSGLCSLQGKQACDWACTSTLLRSGSHCAARDLHISNPGVEWDDIAGLEDAKRVLQENVILPLLMPDYFQGIRRPVKVWAFLTVQHSAMHDFSILRQDSRDSAASNSLLCS